jgi:opacity protein-like surface antigen
MANAYVDLGTWWCITPFIGAGVGGARVAINGFTDQGIANNGGGALPGLAYGDNFAKWNFAWAVHAGLAYKVTPNFTVELAYRYLDMGDGLTGDLRTFDGTNGIYNPMTFKNITSHDLKLGVRWDLISPQVYAPPPLIRKG